MSKLRMVPGMIASIALAFLLCGFTEAFIGGRGLSQNQKFIERRETALSAGAGGNIFDAFMQFFDGRGDNNNDDEKKNEVDDNLPAGTTVLVSIPGRYYLRIKKSINSFLLC